MLKRVGYIFSLVIIFSFYLEAKSLLYQVNSENATVYILGSIHLAKPELYPLNKEITQAYKKADVLVVELDPSSPESTQEMQKTMMTLGGYAEGKTLKSELSKKTYESLKTYTDKTQIHLELLEKMRPWVVMLQLTITEMMRLGYVPELGIDQHFLSLAKEEKKKIISLETAKEQMALLSKPDKKFQDELLFYTLESMQDLEPMLEDMYYGWKRGDEKAFEEIMMAPLEEDPSLQEMYDELITKRNYAMTDKILNFLKTDKKYFVVVGSGHVIGKKGIVALLREKGFLVNQK